MIKLKLFKGFAIVNFLVLLTAFLLYRNGSLDNLMSLHSDSYLSSPNGGVGVKNSKDSINIETDSLQHQRLFSSMPPANLANLTPRIDTIIPDQDSTVIKLHRMMSSSKSGVIIEPKPITTPQKKRNNKRK